MALSAQSPVAARGREEDTSQAPLRPHRIEPDARRSVVPRRGDRGGARRRGRRPLRALGARSRDGARGGLRGRGAARPAGRAGPARPDGEHERGIRCPVQAAGRSRRDGPRAAAELPAVRLPGGPRGSAGLDLSAGVRRSLLDRSGRPREPPRRSRHGTPPRRRAGEPEQPDRDCAETGGAVAAAGDLRRSRRRSDLGRGVSRLSGPGRGRRGRAHRRPGRLRRVGRGRRRRRPRGRRAHVHARRAIEELRPPADEARLDRGGRPRGSRERSPRAARAHRRHVPVGRDAGHARGGAPARNRRRHPVRHPAESR